MDLVLFILFSCCESIGVVNDLVKNPEVISYHVQLHKQETYEVESFFVVIGLLIEMYTGFLWLAFHKNLLLGFHLLLELCWMFCLLILLLCSLADNGMFLLFRFEKDEVVVLSPFFNGFCHASSTP
ncbi:hypothetical protein RHMOL_Rhmol03G0213100 [Rhododendron molle]|uniref:Uncharacterized protein n=1 Tax=Rhododendron molle TaxID=49168 RepID=A0ACC0PJZ6_RHOML|nr:hypothetical protein RHMOL_Rhmol03G0213100 [Rhododendron molle]